ncbi:MAG: hypothetical protein DMG03_16130 [Acidobacteria bacterium]|nr:MAG: hypothetical protein DMG03_16130 [Acidobacteriota bacterium]
MVIETQAAGPFMQNGFIVACDESREAVIIDPGDGVRDLLAFAERNSLAIRHILLTHAHVDHVTGVGAAKRALNVPIYLHRDDLFLYDRAVESGAMFGLHVETPPPVDVFYSPGQVIAFGTLSRRRVPANWHARSAREGLIRRRYAVRGIDRTDRPAWRRLPHADFLDTRRAVRVWRRCGRPSGPWTSDNHRPRAKEQSVPRGNARLRPLATARLKASCDRSAESLALHSFRPGPLSSRRVRRGADRRRRRSPSEFVCR